MRGKSSAGGRPSGGAAMFAVMGGRLSEGVNFSDGLARAVVIVGLPFPNVMNAEVAERASHYAKMRGAPGGAGEYVENMCMRTVNQTLGMRGGTCASPSLSNAVMGPSFRPCHTAQGRLCGCCACG